MKIIKYQLCTDINLGTEDAPKIEQVFSAVTLGWSAANETIAKAEAYNGEYTIEDDGEPEPVAPPSTADLAADLASVQSISIAAFTALCETQVLDDNTAVQHAEVFELWAVDMSYTVNQMRRDPLTGLLYRCAQAHTAQEGWNPSLTPALWTVVDVTHAGTLDDPIPAARGMEYEYGKHYLDPEDNAIYRCARTGEASGGKVTLCGEDITHASTAERVQKGLVLAPEGRHLFPYLTVQKNLLLGATQRKDKDGIQADLEFCFELFPILKDRLKQKAGTMSGGQQQMLAIARGIMAAPKLLCLDEPSLGLAPAVIEDIGVKIREINKTKGTSILLVEQNVHLAFGTAEYCYTLQVGELVAEGNVEEIRQNDVVKKAYFGG